MNELPAGGVVRSMTRWGESVMHARCAPVTSYGEALKSLLADMVATMNAADGVGLAANQIGVSLSVFVFDCPDEGGVRHRGVVCNPSLVLPAGKDRVLDDADEGCLSLPGAFISCPRTDQAKVMGFDQHGKPVTYSGRGLFARCLQHESDHVNGVVFADRLPDRARKRLYREAEQVAVEFPHDWPVEPRALPRPD